MARSSVRGARGRLVASAALGGLVAILLALVPGAGLGVSLGRNDRTTAYAQGDMDVDIVSPSFADLPLAVEPGQQFDVNAITAPGAGCSGQVTFRDLPPVDLEARPAPGGTCSWPVDVPPTTRPGTATITVNVARNGQGWTLYGVVYVRPVGESG